MYSRHRRKAVNEVISSLLVLAITVSLLSGIFYFASSTVSRAEKNAEKSNQAYQKRLGCLISLVFESSNITGTYLYFYNYGWEDTYIIDVYMKDKRLPFATNCSPVKPGSLCYLVLEAPEHGILSIVTTGETIYENV